MQDWKFGKCERESLEFSELTPGRERRCDIERIEGGKKHDRPCLPFEREGTLIKHCAVSRGPTNTEEKRRGEETRISGKGKKRESEER